MQLFVFRTRNQEQSRVVFCFLITIPVYCFIVVIHFPHLTSLAVALRHSPPLPPPPPGTPLHFHYNWCHPPPPLLSMQSLSITLHHYCPIIVRHCRFVSTCHPPLLKYVLKTNLSKLLYFLISESTFKLIYQIVLF